VHVPGRWVRPRLGRVGRTPQLATSTWRSRSRSSEKALCVGAHAQCTSRHTPRFPRLPPAILRLCSSNREWRWAWIKRAEIRRQTHHAATHSCKAFVPSCANLLHHRRVTKTFCALCSWPCCGVLRKSVIYTLKKHLTALAVNPFYHISRDNDAALSLVRSRPTRSQNEASKRVNIPKAGSSSPRQYERCCRDIKRKQELAVSLLRCSLCIFLCCGLPLIIMLIMGSHVCADLFTSKCLHEVT
jgi:hypothetical protein